MGRWTQRLKKDPTSWLLDKSCPPIRYRTMTEITGLPESDIDVTRVRNECYNYKPAHTISTLQSDEGTWFNSHVGFEATNVPRRRGPGTASQYHALIEYGWRTDHPIVHRTAELFQQLLWEDPTVDLLELKGYCGGDPAVESYLRRHLSWRALALLSRSGFSEEPGVQRKTRDLIGILDKFYDGDFVARLAPSKLIRKKETDEGPVDEECTVMTTEVPIPDHVLWLILAHNNEFRTSPVGKKLIERLTDHILEYPAPPVPVVEVAGKVFDRDMDLSIRTLGIEDYKNRKLVGRLLQELEILARCGVLERSPKAIELLEWLIGLQDDEGVVRADEFIEKHVHRIDYPYFPLEDNWRGKHKKFTDLTFRLFLILTIMDRT